MFKKKNEYVWEEFISLGASSPPIFETLNPVNHYLNMDDKSEDWGLSESSLKEAVSKDPFPLPHTEHREGYWGGNHFNYWASGLQDYSNVQKCLEYYSLQIKDYLDFGCASGRVLRHFALQQSGTNVYGTDLNRRHIDWINRFFPSDIIAFQNHSIPYLSLPDESMDVITAFSVFTHIEAFDTSWLMELRRVLRPGGLAWITVHTEDTWNSLKPDWPLYKGLKDHPKFKKLKKQSDLPEERLVFRWDGKRSYSSNVFYSTDYLYRVWSRFMTILEIRHRCPRFQDVVILQKQ